MKRHHHAASRAVSGSIGPFRSQRIGGGLAGFPSASRARNAAKISPKVWPAFQSGSKRATKQSSSNATPSKSEEEKWKEAADAVVIFRVEIVERLPSYGGASILLGHSWYVVRGRVVSVLHGEIPPEL